MKTKNEKESAGKTIYRKASIGGSSATFEAIKQAYNLSREAMPKFHSELDKAETLQDKIKILFG